jgi:hypothetical protein
VRRLAWLVAAAVAGCAAPVPAGQVEWTAIVGFEETLRRLEEDIPRAMADGGRPDCDRACFLARNVCLIAARICGIAGAFPGDRDARTRCRDAETRCDRARARVHEKCRCL